MTNSSSDTPSQESSIVTLYKNFYKRLILTGTPWIKRAGLRKAVCLHGCSQMLLLFCAENVTVSEGGKSLIPTAVFNFEKVFVCIVEIIFAWRGKPLPSPPCQQYLLWYLKVLLQGLQRLCFSAFPRVIYAVRYSAQ